MSVERLTQAMPVSDGAAGHWYGHGGSAIIAPGGRYLVEPLFDEETIITAEIDLADIAVNKWFFDGTGHYSRPDVFQLRWDKRPKPAVDMVRDE
jgi:nitrilase